MDKGDKGLEPKVKTEHPDPAVADRKPKGKAVDRPGFDLGGARETQPSGPTTGKVAPHNPGAPKPGRDELGRGEGVADISGSRSTGTRTGPGSASGGGSTDGSGHPE